jgi:uncharacterized protein YlzI (FlbEa/FlbD family)
MFISLNAYNIGNQSINNFEISGLFKNNDKSQPIPTRDAYVNPKMITKIMETPEKLGERKYVLVHIQGERPILVEETVKEVLKKISTWKRSETFQELEKNKHIATFYKQI